MVQALAVLDLVRREDSEVTADSLKAIVRRASEKLEEDGLGPLDCSEWGDFETRSRFVYTWLLGKYYGHAREGRRHQQQTPVRALPEYLELRRRHPSKC